MPATRYPFEQVNARYDLMKALLWLAKKRKGDSEFQIDTEAERER
jgi:hypothetical protein